MSFKQRFLMFLLTLVMIAGWYFFFIRAVTDPSGSQSNIQIVKPQEDLDKKIVRVYKETSQKIIEMYEDTLDAVEKRNSEYDVILENKN